MAKTKASENGKALTEYVVLEAVDIEAIAPDSRMAIGMEHRLAPLWAPVLNATDEQGPDGQPRVFLAAGKTQAIRQHTGEGADVIEGAWKAVPLSSWRGGEQTKRVTVSERLPFEDAPG